MNGQWFMALLDYLYKHGSDIIPWLLITLLIYGVFSLKPVLVKWVEEKAAIQKAYTEKEGERNEIIRNNTAAMEACTAALNLVSEERDKCQKMIENHDILINNKVSELSGLVHELSTDVKILKDRD